MGYLPHSPGITNDIALHCEDELGRPMAFMASFAYHPDDPYAVAMTFHVPAGDVAWVVARSLLHTGLTEPAGDGDVRLWPGVDEDGCAVVGMDFHSPEGRMVVHVRSGELLAFLMLTWAVVAPGTEGERVDLDQLVAALLS